MVITTIYTGNVNITVWTQYNYHQQKKVKIKREFCKKIFAFYESKTF